MSARRVISLFLIIVLVGGCKVTSPSPSGPLASGSPVAAPCQAGTGPDHHGVSQDNPAYEGFLRCAVFDGSTLNNPSFAHADLAGASFRRAALNNPTFASASLVGAVFTGATLTNPSFAGADLRGADLRGATLIQAGWQGATCPDGTAAGSSCSGTHLNPLPVR
jgi:uncharacterized protein YjbI with pentapeptide repeats